MTRDGPLEALGATKDLIERRAAMSLDEAPASEAAGQAKLMQPADFKGAIKHSSKRPAKFNQSR
jgi:hypothetical protein